ncbi:MAG: flavodoxin family protein [Candidatus Adiutrix sp.]|jgi:multimeric flavodoxin WrbA|nr:flavodoxin family protein [Candidatus Adiutrix sp.]
MSKTATVIVSSPRKGSNSGALAEAIAAGLTESGVTVETLDLSILDIKPCRACEGCQRNLGLCIQPDDMEAVYPKVRAADVLVLSSPVYWFNMSGLLKTFLDRCFAVAMVGERPFAQKTIAAALAYGDADPYVSGAVNAIRTFQDICAYTGAAWGGCVYASALSPNTLSQDQSILDKAKELGRALSR